MSLVIDNCQVCKNRSELKTFEPDGRQVCGECLEALIFGNARKRAEIAEPEQQVIYGVGNKTRLTVAPQTRDPERQEYLDVILRKADPSWVQKFIKEVVAKKILRYDWQTVIGQERWFSLLDLRRMAIELEPNIEHPESEGQNQDDPDMSDN